MIPNGFLPIANHLWQSTLFAGIAGLLTLLLRNNRAHARYCLWLAASAKFLVPFSLLMLAGGLVGRHSVAVPAPTRVPVIVEQVNEPFVAEVPPGAVAMPHASKSGTLVAPMLVALWAIGCGALVFSWWVRWRRIQVVVRTASPVPLGIGVPALSSASILEPGVFGVFRPVLLLPDGIGDRLAPAELQAILAHELCHVRRRDNLATLMHMVVEAVFWFHPLVWWLGARLMDERERACDEEVLQMGSEAEAYAEGILKICELYLQSPLKCVAGVTGTNLKKRIEAIMANRPMLNLNLPKKAGLILAGILAVAIPVILGITNAPELRAQAESVPKQDITGTWQGKLMVPQAPNGELRIVFKILKVDEGALKATFYMIDRPVPGLPASDVAIQGSNVTITIPGIGGTYEGKLDADATTLTGKWTAGGMPMPLTLAHVKDDAAWEIPKLPPAPRMMAADADPIFAVATIKPSDPNRRRLFSIGNGTEVTAVGTTVRDLIVFAYGVHTGQITGAPAWLESDKFDIRGKPEGEGRPNPVQFKTMLQKLLADRFQLAFHRDKKQLGVYALTVGKNGPKLTRSEAVSPIPNLVPRGPGNLPARNATMEEFAGVMQSHLDRPVVDQTGLKERFDFQLQWTPDEFTSLGAPGEPLKPPEGNETQPDLFTAIQQQLGLKLESTKAQIDVFVIDKVEKPSEN
jgi:uncharacterized protein (TIGR03435 family)